MTTALATTEKKKEQSGLTFFVKQPFIESRFREVLKDRAPQFISSLISLTNANKALKEADPRSIVAAAMTAATLDLPIQKDLGFAHIVPYKGKAQFQMGYKGYIQLAMRSGQYERMNAVKVNAEAWGGTDDFGEPVIHWDKLDETKPPVAYAFIFKTIGGFRKCAAMTVEQVKVHAERFSQAYKAEKKDSPWFTNFDAMGLKTVTSLTLRKWGILSVELQRALAEDQGVKSDIDAPPEYLDNDDEPDGQTLDAQTGEPVKGVAGVKAKLKRAEPEPKPEDPTADEFSRAFDGEAEK